MPSVTRFIYLVQKVEAAYPEWTTDQLITNLRLAAGYDTPVWRQLLGTNPGTRITARGKLTQQEIAELELTMGHATSGTQELGISIDDSTGRNVAMGHVITGISAGIHHPHPIVVEIGPVQKIFPNITKTRLDLDPLYATTITGDLGQTVTAPNTLCSQTKCIFGGVGSEATSAELHGDIDGFMLGYWLSATIAGQEYRSSMVQNNSTKVSTMLDEYYRGRTDRPFGMMAGSGFPLEATRRFFNFKETYKALRDDFTEQSVSFHYYYAIGFGKQVPNPFKLNDAIIDFENWCNRGGV
ncbi:hypothetical protein IQ250_18085 [Pseudanabaenaceae cyanobacterium LEGE 13415]|nr:hypothetical protein [Pseudanabaenaceae cyanobacterium LEGE 13415]